MYIYRVNPEPVTIKQSQQNGALREALGRYSSENRRLSSAQFPYSACDTRAPPGFTPTYLLIYRVLFLPTTSHS